MVDIPPDEDLVRAYCRNGMAENYTSYYAYINDKFVRVKMQEVFIEPTEEDGLYSVHTIIHELVNDEMKVTEDYWDERRY